MDKSKKKKAGIIAGSVLAVGIAAGGITAGVIAGTAKVTIKFNTGESGLEYKEETIKKGSTTKLPTPIWAGHKFIGWYLDAAFTIKAEEGTKYGKDTTLYGRWEESTYTVNYVDKVNEGEEPTRAVGRYNRSVVVRNPENKYYEFKGWSEYVDGRELIGEESSNSQGESITTYDMPLYGATLYAIWEGKEVEVELDGEKKTYKVGEKLLLPNTTKASPTGNYFAGFRINGKEYLPGSEVELTPEMINGDAKFRVVIEASWIDRLENNIVYVDYDGTKIEIEEELGAPKHRDGYKFLGWYRNARGEGEKVTTLSDEDKTGKSQVALYAKYEADRIEIQYNYNDGVKVGEETGKEKDVAEVGEKIQLTFGREYARINLDLVGWRIGKKEIKLGETVTCKYSKQEEKHIVVIESQNGKILNAVIELRQ